MANIAKPISKLPVFAKIQGKNIVDLNGKIIGTTNGKTFTLTSNTPATTTTPTTVASSTSTSSAKKPVAQTTSGTTTATTTAKKSTVKTPVTSTTTAVTAPTGAFDPADPAWKAFTSKYGVPAAYIQSDPTGELQKLFTTAMDQHYSLPEFQQAFIATKFAQTHSSQWQAAESARIQSPVTYADQYNRAADYLATLQGQMGYSVDPALMGKNFDPNNPAASHIDANGQHTYDPNNLIDWTLHNYYGQNLGSPDIANQIKQHIVQLSKNNPNQQIGGDKAANINQIRSWAKDYGLSSLVLPPGAVGSDFASNAAQSIEMGTTTLDTWKTNLMAQAANIYKPFAKQIMDGITVDSLAMPYKNALSGLLENVSPDSIDLSATDGYGAMVSSALKGTDPANPQAMSLDQFMTQVKQRPEWLNTTNARNSMMDTANQLLHSFGLVVD